MQKFDTKLKNKVEIAYENKKIELREQKKTRTRALIVFIFCGLFKFIILPPRVRERQFLYL